MNINIQEAQQIPSRMSSETHTVIYYNHTVKRQRQRKNVEISKREATHLGKRSSRRLTANFSLETLEERGQCSDIFKVLIGKSVTKNPISSKNCPLQVKLKLRHF